MTIRIHVQKGFQMPCSGLSSHVYALHLLGLADEPERSDVRFHIRRGCGTCLRSLSSALEFWFVFACYADSLGEDLDFFPGLDLRDRILNSVLLPTLHQLADPSLSWDTVDTILASGNGRALTGQLERFSAHLELVDSRSRTGTARDQPASSTPTPMVERKR